MLEALDSSPHHQLSEMQPIIIREKINEIYQNVNNETFFFQQLHYLLVHGVVVGPPVLPDSSRNKQPQQLPSLNEVVAVDGEAEAVDPQLEVTREVDIILHLCAFNGGKLYIAGSEATIEDHALLNVSRVDANLVEDW